MAIAGAYESGELKRRVTCAASKPPSTLGEKLLRDFRFLDSPHVSQPVAPAFGGRGEGHSPGCEVFGSRACDAFRVHPN